MEFVTPRVYILAQTTMAHMLPEEFEKAVEQQQGVEAFLESIGATNWSTDVNNDIETLIEMAGKTCYRSFNTKMNPNLTKVRDQDNETYLGNILKQCHGSVLEHAVVTFGFVNVSRIFTHELVRHRIAAFSQESLRYVRLTNLKAYFPQCFEAPFLKRVGIKNPQAASRLLRRWMKEDYEHAEKRQAQLSHLLQLDKKSKKMGFHAKKQLTSAMRRFVPDGMATVIICTMNMRMWRHVIEMRTSIGAEEEIRLVFDQVARLLNQHYPNVFQDFVRTDDGQWASDNGKV